MFFDMQFFMSNWETEKESDPAEGGRYYYSADICTRQNVFKYK